jgi:hypothetical protein
LLSTAQEVQLSSGTQYSYASFWYRVGAQTSLTFEVQACSNAFVGLFDQHMVEMAYEVSIGGDLNTMSSIRRARVLETKYEVKLFRYVSVTQSFVIGSVNQ